MVVRGMAVERREAYHLLNGRCRAHSQILPLKWRQGERGATQHSGRACLQAAQEKEISVGVWLAQLAAAKRHKSLGLDMYVS